jgi:hypothetical protein
VVKSAQAALAAAKQPNTPQDIQAQRDQVVAARQALAQAQHPGSEQDIRQAQDAVAVAADVVEATTPGTMVTVIPAA